MSAIVTLLGFAAAIGIVSVVYHLFRLAASPDAVGDRVLACLSCGSRDLSGLKFLMAWQKKYLPITGVYCCQACGHTGLPMEFDSEEHYEESILQLIVPTCYRNIPPGLGSSLRP